MEDLENFARNLKIDDSGKNSEDSDYSGDENEIVPGNKEGRDSKDKKGSVEGREPRQNTMEKGIKKKNLLPPSKSKKK